MKKIFLILLLLSGLVSMAQPQDSVNTLTITDLLALVREHHPLLRQAELQDGFAAAEITKARGSLDPKIISSYSSKDLNNTNYYDKFSSYLKIPTWFPMDPKVEINRNNGDFLSSESYISSSTNYWQVTSGISLPVGKGLFIDERRSIIKQSLLLETVAEAERNKLINSTLLDIIKTYWEWYNAQQQYELMVQSIAIAENLFERVKIDFELGEASVVDTVQSMITYQSRKIDYENAALYLKQAKLAMNIHLWGPGETPLELTDEVVPTAAESIGIVPGDSSLQYMVDWARVNHPDLVQIDTRLDQLQIEQRWNRESLKPEINLTYALIDAPLHYEGFQAPQWTDNYKLGVDFSFPLFLRKERGMLQKTKLYIEQGNYYRTQLEQEITTNIKSAYEVLKTNEILVTEYRNMADGYRRLLDAELFNLEIGESDLFRLNFQQDKYIESRIKYLDSFMKYQNQKAQLPYVIGLPDLSFQNLYE